MPPFYIGSTSVENIIRGYRGSVNSKKYGKIWRSELSKNPHLFKTQIISYSETRKDALLKERKFHQHLRVNVSPLYVNQNLASPDGICGVSMKGKDNPMYGKSRPDLSAQNAERKGKSVIMTPKRQAAIDATKGTGNPMYGKNHSLESKRKMAEAVTGRTYPKEPCSFCKRMISVNNLSNHIASCNQNPNRYQKFKHKLPRSEDQRKKLSELRKNEPKLKCPHCGTLADKRNSVRWHFENCKFNY